MVRKSVRQVPKKSSNPTNLEIVTEVGVFGSLNIEDPTVKKVKKKRLPNGEIVEEGEMDMDVLAKCILSEN